MDEAAAGKGEVQGVARRERQPVQVGDHRAR
jgi:hypothetical protein